MIYKLSCTSSFVCNLLCKITPFFFEFDFFDYENIIYFDNNNFDFYFEFLIYLSIPI